MWRRKPCWISSDTEADVPAPDGYARIAAKRIYFRGRTNAKREREAIQRSWSRHASHVSFDEDVQHVMDLLASLPTEQREVMAWTIDGYESGEIAELTGRMAATVRSHCGTRGRSSRM